MIVNVTDEGNGFPWHFDTNNYTVTLALQNGDRGGEFEYVPWLRSATDENYGGVQSVLDETSDGVRTLVLEPGDLQLFKGCLLYTSPSPRDVEESRMPSSA